MKLGEEDFRYAAEIAFDRLCSMVRNPDYVRIMSFSDYMGEIRVEYLAYMAERFRAMCSAVKHSRTGQFRMPGTDGRAGIIQDCPAPNFLEEDELYC